MMLPTSLSQPLRALVLLSLVVAGVSLGLAILPFHLDDAFITYRYARNVADGHGLTFNPGMAPVEGFSSPIWLLLLSVVAATAGADVLPQAAVAFGLASFVAVLWIMMRAALRLGGEQRQDAATWAGIATVGLFATLPAASYYAVTGLEPVLFVLAVVVFVGSTAGLLPQAAGLVAGALAVWIRPEGMFFVIVLPVQLLAQGGWRDRGLRRPTSLLAAVLLGGLSVVAVRLVVFGELLPNTYFAKEPDLAKGLAYVASVLATGHAGLLTFLALLGAVFGMREHRGLFAAGLCWLAAAALEGGDWMPLGRLALPALGCFALSAGGVFHLRPSLLGRRWHRPLTAIFVVLCCLAIWINVARARFQADIDFHTSRLDRENAALAHWLQRSGGRSVGLVDIGRIGFFTNLEIVDIVGLTDRRIGRSPGGHLDKRFDQAYLFEERRPDFLVIRVRRPPRVVEGAPPRVHPEMAIAWIEYRIMTDPRLRDHYGLLFSMLPGYVRAEYYGKLVFARRDFVPGPDAVPFSPIMAMPPLDG
jgi:hypothetical protein